jgi:hypothetical protein
MGSILYSTGHWLRLIKESSGAALADDGQRRRNAGQIKAPAGGAVMATAVQAVHLVRVARLHDVGAAPPNVVRLGAILVLAEIESRGQHGVNQHALDAVGGLEGVAVKLECFDHGNVMEKYVIRCIIL